MLPVPLMLFKQLREHLEICMPDALFETTPLVLIISLVQFDAVIPRLVFELHDVKILIETFDPSDINPSTALLVRLNTEASILMFESVALIPEPAVEPESVVDAFEMRRLDFAVWHPLPTQFVTDILPNTETSHSFK